MDEEMLELIWTNHGPIFRYWLTEHREKEKYTDATIGCEGKLYAVHKLVLATCSNYFDEVFEHTEGKHPVLLLHDVKQHELEAILCYMYTGSANVSQLNLTRFMMVAKALQIKGLAVPDGDSGDPLVPMESPGLDEEAKGPSSSGYCWQDNEIGTPHTIPSNLEIPGGFPDIKEGVACRKDKQIAKAKRSEGNESQGQYSFPGFKYTNIEGGNNRDLIKKREVLEKIISQTEKQFVVDGGLPEPTAINDEYHSLQDIQIKQEVDDSSSDQKKPVKKDKLSSATHSKAKLLKGTMRRKLNGQKKHKLKKGKLRKMKHILGHASIKVHKCPQCPASFNRKFALRHHLQNHDCVEDFLCTYCHAKFTNKELLSSHLSTHDQSKPYECALCHTSFSRKDKLTVHLKNHEDQGKSKVTTQVKNFNGKVFMCDECPATFEIQSQFVEHSQMHASERQFPCTVCPAAFAKKVHLSRHVLTHKGFGSRDKFQDTVE